MSTQYKRIFLDLFGGVFFDRIVTGIMEYSRKNQQWTFIRMWPGIGGAEHLIENTRPDGVIFCDISPRWNELLTKLGIPYVTILANPQVNAPRASIDDHAIGTLAAAHFLERGLKYFGFCGYSNHPWSIGREKGFALALHDAGYDFSSCKIDLSAEKNVSTEMARIEQWIIQLAKPAGVFICHDAMASQVSEFCRRNEIHIPDQIALLGVDNQESECEFAIPPLSSVITGDERIGYEAATMLDGLMQGGDRPEQPVLVPPVGIVTRQSTDLVAVDEPEIAAAIRFIRDNAHKPIQVTDILRHAPLSRTTLETRFRKILGRTPMEEIRRIHVERAKELLTHTDLAMARIAARSGFPHPSNMATIFKKMTGLSPSEYRRKFRVYSRDH